MDRQIGYIFQDPPWKEVAGHPSYATAEGDELLWGCVGNWFSGHFWDPKSIPYIDEVRSHLAERDWLHLRGIRDLLR